MPRNTSSRTFTSTFPGILLIFAVIFAIATVMYVLLDSSHIYKPEITQTSSNTWHIYAPDNDPDRYVRRTCQTQGREVAQLAVGADSYDEMDVVCK